MRQGLATVLSYLPDVPPQLQEAVRHALIDDTYVNDGGVGADSRKLLSKLQIEIDKILKKGIFWESRPGNLLGKQEAANI